MTEDPAIRMAVAQAAQKALDEFLTPAFDTVRIDYIEKLAAIAAKPMTPDNKAGLEKLALAVKVVDQVALQVKSLVVDGGIAEKERDHARQIEKIPASTRKFF